MNSLEILSIVFFCLADSLKIRRDWKCIQDAEFDVAIYLRQYNSQIKILKQMVFPREQMSEHSDGAKFKNIDTTEMFSSCWGSNHL